MDSSVRRAAMIAGACVGCAVLGWKLWKRGDLRRKNRAIPRGKKIVIVGAGFAGLNVAQELSRLLPAENDGQIALIDQNNYLLFTPMLTEVAGGELDPHHILAPPRLLSSRITFEQGRVHDVDLQNKAITLEVGGDGSGRRTLKADQIVIALLDQCPTFMEYLASRSTRSASRALPMLSKSAIAFWDVWNRRVRSRIIPFARNF